MSQLQMIQSTLMQGTDIQIGLTDLLLATLKRYHNPDLFTKTQIVVPNHAMASFAKDLITREDGICCNYDFVVLLGPVLENIYKQNNPDFVMFDFNQAKFIIYDYLCSIPINSLDADEINSYLYKDNQINLANAFELAIALEKIFHEYLYLRTEELVKISVIKPQPSDIKKLKHKNGKLSQNELDLYDGNKDKIILANTDNSNNADSNIIHDTAYASINNTIDNTIKSASSGNHNNSQSNNIKIDKNSKIKIWQQQIWQYLINKIDGKKTFIDIYLYYMEVKNIEKLPHNLFIFGLTSIYPSQLQIVKRLSKFIPIYWFYLATSNQYYGDLLSDKARDSLSKKTLRKPDLSLDDLYLTDGNPLLANLGQQSREFVELLRANDIETYVVGNSVQNQSISSDTRTQNYDDNVGLDSQTRLSLRGNDDVADPKVEPEDDKVSCLKVIQNDIRNLTYRITPDYRLNSDSIYYANPIKLATKSNNAHEFEAFDTQQSLTSIDEKANLKTELKTTPNIDKIYDLPKQQLSIKINNCHNKMREVQVMFNELVQVLDKNPTFSLNDILVTSLDIDNYAPYISAVFDNETISNDKNQTLLLPYNITGSRRNRQYSQLATIKLLFNVPYHLPVSYLLDVLTQTDIGQSQVITTNDVELIKTWLKDNNTHFGYNALDYNEYGYHDYDVNSFSQLLNNLVLGACIPNEVAKNQQIYPTYTTDSSSFTPYDNLDNSQIELANKLISLINLLVELRSKLYLDRSTYREITLFDAIALLTTLKDIIAHDETSELHYTQFLGNLSLIRLDTPITLPIFNQLIDEYTDQIKTKIRFDGSITCASIQYMRNIPYKVIYILGMNVGEFPRAYNPNRLSILSGDWYLADRNYTNEDKQAFLDTILACNRQLFISYIGRVDTDNSEIKPSPLLDLLLNTIGQSFTDFQIKNSIKFDYHNLLVKHSLHPFYNNSEPNFSSFWAKISQTTGGERTSSCWDFINPPKINLTSEQQELYYKPTLNRIISTFCFTNANLYNTLGIRNNHEIELVDYEPLLIKDKNLAKQLFKYFEQYKDQAASNTNELYEYLTLSGMLSYKNLGLAQFQHYFTIYQNYTKLRGTRTVNLELAFNVISKDNQIHNLIISDSVWLDAENNIIVCDDFHNLNGVSKTVANDIPLQLRIKANLIYLITQNGGKCIVTYGGDIAVNSIILRLIDSVNTEKFDFTLSLQEGKSSDVLLNSFLRYYLYSLTNPIPIHKNAINTYIKNISKNPLEENIAVTQAQNALTANYENYDLERLKDDIVFSSLMPGYFEFCANNKIPNHIITMGKLLANINLK